MRVGLDHAAELVGPGHGVTLLEEHLRTAAHHKTMAVLVLKLHGLLEILLADVEALGLVGGEVDVEGKLCERNVGVLHAGILSHLGVLRGEIAVVVQGSACSLQVLVLNLELHGIGQVGVETGELGLHLGQDKLLLLVRLLAILQLVVAGITHLVGSLGKESGVEGLLLGGCRQLLVDELREHEVLCTVAVEELLLIDKTRSKSLGEQG